jgi:hypothetical protein
MISSAAASCPTSSAPPDDSSTSGRLAERPDLGFSRRRTWMVNRQDATDAKKRQKTGEQRERPDNPS